MRYLPKFKWHQLKEDKIYNRQVRKVRLAQKIGQARRENDFFLEKVHEAKSRERIAERRAAKGGSTSVPQISRELPRRGAFGAHGGGASKAASGGRPDLAPDSNR